MKNNKQERSDIYSIYSKVIFKMMLEQGTNHSKFIDMTKISRLQ